MSLVCKYCAGPLTEMRIDGRPDEPSLHCRSDHCRFGWVDQGSRNSGAGSIQVAFGAKGISRIQQGRPSQGEDNCGPVCAVVLAWLGDDFAVGQPCPEEGAKRDSVIERGFDFTVHLPCGHETEIQVTRIKEEAHFAALGKEGHVSDEREHATLVDLIEDTVRSKSDKTPPSDRSKRILAIDGRCPSVGLNLFFANVRFVNMSEVFGWGGVLLVVDKSNTRFLDRDRWPACPLCL